MWNKSKIGNAGEENEKIFVIGTGRAIASKPEKSGLAPALFCGKLTGGQVHAASISEVECAQAFFLDSTNVRPGYWLLLENLIYEKHGE